MMAPSHKKEQPAWRNKLFYGDNLHVLRDPRYIKDESVDLIYLDPPFKSDQNYNLLFEEKDGKRPASQIQAFEDTWNWDDAAVAVYEETITKGPENVSLALRGFKLMLGTNDLLAYLVMMAPRLVEMKRVLKPRGSIYLHCDPAASHYLKALMDSVFGGPNFRNEIIWKRQSAHSDAKRFGAVHDVLLFYAKGSDPVWDTQRQPYSEAYLTQYYRYKDEDGRRWMSADLSAAGLTGGGYEYEWKGVKRIWRCPEKTMRQYEQEGRLFYTKTGIPRLKRYLDEAKGMPAQDVWDDLESLRSWHKERLGFPTQKPEALLERIIRSSSEEGAVVLDPFCGCGTAVAVAHRLNRKWIGIDVTHLAVRLMKQRLFDSFGILQREDYEVIGEPTDVSGAEELCKEDPFQFQNWALGLVHARPVEIRRGMDRGIDGRRLIIDPMAGGIEREMIFSVKCGKATPDHVRVLKAVVEREGADVGILVALKRPTKEMTIEAAEAGFGEAWGRKFRRIQILTIDQLLAGDLIDYPPGALHSDVTLRKAPKARKKGPKNGEIPFHKD